MTVTDEMQYRKWYPSPLGRILLAADETALIGLWFEGQKYFARGLSPDCQEKDTPVLDEAARWLTLCFSGRRPEHTPPLRPCGTPFQRTVWALLQAVPCGTTVTYGTLAQQATEKMGTPRTSARAVGNAVSRNPISIIIPCHRVVGADGSLTGYAGGLERKTALLRLEQSPLALRLKSE